MKNVKRNIFGQNFFLGFQGFTSTFFEKFMKGVKRNIISQNFFLGFQLFTSIFFESSSTFGPMRVILSEILSVVASNVSENHKLDEF